TTTLPVSLDEMLHHCRAVARGIEASVSRGGGHRPLLICDLPFLSYQCSSDDAVAAAGRVLKETAAAAVKLEGAEPETRIAIDRMVRSGIPVMGHLGLTPQSIYKFGTYVVRAKEEAEAQRLREDAKLLEQAGCFALVLEKIPAKLAAEVAQIVSIPVIGIGAGPGVDGQVLVLHDMLGINTEFRPRFLRRYADLHSVITGAVSSYVADVRAKDFPKASEQY
ncbi:MAG: 3-methyl-2-oxobutanoate hydroxymethyltransferase, partial [Flavobacteriales bacterium]